MAGEKRSHQKGLNVRLYKVMSKRGGIRKVSHARILLPSLCIHLSFQNNAFTATKPCNPSAQKCLSISPLFSQCKHKVMSSPHLIIYRLGVAFTICLCLFNQLLGASCLRCSTTWLLCNRLVRSYQAVAIKAFSRVRFLIMVSFAAFTGLSNQHSQSHGP